MRYPFDKYNLGTRFGTKGNLWKCGGLTIITNINPAVPQILQHNIIMPSLFNGLHFNG